MSILLGLTLLFLSPAGGQDLRNPEFMAQAKRGFQQLFNLDYGEARDTFQRLAREYPEHPAPPLYEATSLWLEELFLRQDLDLEKFVSPGYFDRPTEARMDAQRRRLFFSLVEKSREACRRILERDPEHKDARYFLGTTAGVLAAFAITIDHDKGEAFRHGKEAYRIHHRLVEEDPRYYDAYMSVGMYEYIVGSLPWYIKWLAALIGYRGSKERGFQYLDMAAQNGLYVADEARAMQLVLFVREGHYERALQSVRFLHAKYPKSFLLHLNEAQILERLGQVEEAEATYLEVLRRAAARQPNYHKVPLPRLRFQIAKRLWSLGRLERAREQFQEVVQVDGLPAPEKTLAHLHLGQIQDQLGQREAALEQYRKVLELPDTEEAHKLARRYLRRPFRGP